MPQDTQRTEQQGEVYARAPQHITDADYLTPGKDYLVVESYGSTAFEIIDDADDQIFCLWEDCCHLSGGNWERVA